jgi:hypothetical protein
VIFKKEEKRQPPMAERTNWQHGGAVPPSCGLNYFNEALCRGEPREMNESINASINECINQSSIDRSPECWLRC